MSMTCFVKEETEAEHSLPPSTTPTKNVHSMASKPEEISLEKGNQSGTVETERYSEQDISQSVSKKDTKGENAVNTDDWIHNKANVSNLPFHTYSPSFPVPFAYQMPPNYAVYSPMGGYYYYPTATAMALPHNGYIENNNNNNQQNPSIEASVDNYATQPNGLTTILDAVQQREKFPFYSSSNCFMTSNQSVQTASTESIKEEIGNLSPGEMETMTDKSSVQQAPVVIHRQRQSSHSSEKGPTPFLKKLYYLVGDPETEDLCSWTTSGRSFVIWNPNAFAHDVLPNYFKHNNLSSFVRQLNQYGFHKMHPDAWEFGHARFIRGREDLIATIERRPTRPCKGQDRNDNHDMNKMTRKRPRNDSVSQQERSDNRSKTFNDRGTYSSKEGSSSPPVSTGSATALQSNHYQHFQASSSNGNSPEALWSYPQQPPFKDGVIHTNGSYIEMEKRLSMMEHALGQLQYQVKQLCQERDLLRQEIFILRNRMSSQTNISDEHLTSDGYSNE